MRVAENNGTGGAMMRMSRPQPVSLDKGLCRTGIRSHTAENDTLPYPCDAEIRHRMSEDLERSGYISHMLGKEISSRGESMEMYVDLQQLCSIVQQILSSGSENSNPIFRALVLSVDRFQNRNILFVIRKPD